jgi:hypothetical protein
MGHDGWWDVGSECAGGGARTQQLLEGRQLGVQIGEDLVVRHLEVRYHTSPELDPFDLGLKRMRAR